MNPVLSFMQNPFSLPEATGVKTKWNYFANAFLFLFATRLLLGVLLFVEKLYAFEGVTAILKSHKSFSEDLDRNFVIFLVVVLAPVLEEFAFRGFISHNKQLIRFSLSCFCVLVLNMIYQASVWDDALPALSIVSISVCIAAVVFFSLRLYEEMIFNFLHKNMPVVIYSSVVFFSVLHLLNYSLENLSVAQLFLVPVALVPYLSLAVALSFVRVRCGLGWSIGFHALNNLIVVLISF